MDTDVVVVGAGAAGLAAARTLGGHGLSVVVLEARDRIGGRAFSVPLPGELMPAELGAEFIHGPAPETKALLRDAGSAYVDTGGESWVADRDGKLQREEDEFLDAAELFEGARALNPDVSVDAYLRRFEHDEPQRAQHARHFVEGFEGADPAHASAKAIWAEVSTGVDSISARPIGGYVPVIRQLVTSIDARRVQLHLSSIVSRIAWERGRAAVATLEGTFTARAVIVTVPVGVLRSGALSFEPALTPEVLSALSHVEMGHVVKVVLSFREPFWETVQNGRFCDAGFFRCFKGPFQAYWTQVPLRGSMISAWVGGPKADALLRTTEEERIETALRGFGELLRERDAAERSFVRGVTHDWSADPYAHGAYSYITTGGMGARERLAEPLDDTLFFAGEATSTNGEGGTVNGAIQTGERAARALLERLNG